MDCECSIRQLPFESLPTSARSQIWPNVPDLENRRTTDLRGDADSPRLNKRKHTRQKNGAHEAGQPRGWDYSQASLSLPTGAEHNPAPDRTPRRFGLRRWVLTIHESEAWRSRRAAR